ncbi:hypothetical protein BDY21DRAFT_289035 [Lineolata rhizophorae]|uniref:UBA domain-containing protein n=1 Tax=Lineolata rhizophorae TaxID=578093 RepID=A0A6A6NVY5_9PEZI|nr:hypothetical protein BDY21DRAFT_289035 [Lineolata rhizophorae]
MDDLSGLDWNASNSNSQQPPTAKPTPNYASLRPSPSLPSSGRSTPLSAQPSGANARPQAPAKSSTQAQDSFSGLLSFPSLKQSNNLSLQQRQQQIAEEKARQAEEQRKKYEQQYGARDHQFWDTLGSGSGKSTPQPGAQPNTGLSGTINKPFARLNQTTSQASPPPQQQSSGQDDDLLAAFNADAPVNTSSHFPIPQSAGSGRTTPAQPTGGLSSASEPVQAPDSTADASWGDDDDPFGLSKLPPRPTDTSTQNATADDDDILGMLGKPVSEPPPKPSPRPTVSTPEPRPAEHNEPESPAGDDPRDKAVAELVDMGFPVEKSAIALAQTESGTNVQAAVRWLLQQAHEEARQKTQGGHQSDHRSRSQTPEFGSERERRPHRGRSQRSDFSSPAWMQGPRNRSGSEQQRSGSHSGVEKDVAQYASEIGTTFLKSANSLWKTGQKKVQKAVAEFQHEGDPSQPKWMRDASPLQDASDRAQGHARDRGAHSRPNVTDEAMMLEGGGGPPRKPRPRIEQRGSSIPAVSPSALSASGNHRVNGSAAFKRGDYTAAHQSYTSALTPLPQTHPVTIIILCNRALTNIKMGDPKAAIADADAALVTIGPSRGESERIAVGGAEGDKEMREFYAKALMRKAEALEHLEKWTDAGKVWREAVEAGVGGAVSIQGRNRCDKASGKAPPVSSTPSVRPVASARKPAAPARPSTNGPARPAASSASSAEAVKKLREANAAAEKADDEKFALSDSVDAKLAAWKGTKTDNLRALLGSLDKVLWPEAGWNKVNMADLVMPSRVKIVYMKAIAKVHPDKIPQTATTEQRMISASVFSTLNEAWDKFKKDNNL